MLFDAIWHAMDATNERKTRSMSYCMGAVAQPPMCGESPPLLQRPLLRFACIPRRFDVHRSHHEDLTPT
jgi:hypothetical protein